MIAYSDMHLLVNAKRARQDAYVFPTSKQHRHNILILKMRNRSRTICLERQHQKIHTSTVCLHNGVISGSKLPACAPQSCDRFVKYREGQWETLGGPRRRLKLLMEKWKEERESVDDADSPRREKVNHRRKGKGDFALSHLKGLKGKGRKEARNRWCVVCLSLIPEMLLS